MSDIDEPARRSALYGVIRRLALAAVLSAPAWAVAGVERDPLRSGGFGPPMVVVDIGPFTMGAPPGTVCRGFRQFAVDAARPVREVRIERPFALSRDPVTVGAFGVFVERTGYATDSERAYKRPRRVRTPWRRTGCHALPRSEDEWPMVGWTWDDIGERQSPEHPVGCVSRNDAEAYVRWLSDETGLPYRLPSEAEWEYAARAGRSDAETLRGMREALAAADALSEDLQAVLARRSPPPVTETAVNRFGLRGMSGPYPRGWTAEWVADCWHPNYRDGPDDGSPRLTGQCDDRAVLRRSDAPLCRGAIRSRTYSEPYSGFRVRRPVEASAVSNPKTSP